MGRPAAAAEDALRTPGARVVRLGWVYGHTGVIVAMVDGLRTSRFRLVGAAANAMPLISPDDAAAAMRAAADSPPGVYAAAEDAVPTQKELVHAICAATGALRPDHLPPRMAALSFGGALVEGLMASVPLGPGRLREAGWTPDADWRSDLLRLTRPPGASGSA
jgi:nucleoside-diphosphate-sugar epimerase